MSWGNQTNPVLAADYRRVADFANEYVKTHSYDEPLKKSGLDNLLRKYNIKTNSTIFSILTCVITRQMMELQISSWIVYIYLRGLIIIIIEYWEKDIRILEK